MSHIPTRDDEIFTMQDPDSEYRRHQTRLNELISDGGSLSGRERNCSFLNVKGGKFATVSSVSGLDFLDDARTPVSVDWDQDGDLDLWVGNRTAPQLRFMRNDMPQENHFVALRLRGYKANRDGIGARVEVWTANDSVPLIKTLKAGDGFLGQSSKWLHFGLGKSAKLSRVLVRWPGGDAEEFSAVSADGRFLLEEGKGQAILVPMHVIKFGEAPEPAPLSPQPKGRRIITPTRAALPPLRYTKFEGGDAEIPMNEGKPVLINLWASWCAPCLAELEEWKDQSSKMKAAGIRVFTISVDAIDDNDQSSLTTARAMAGKLGLPFESGMATRELYTRLQQAHDWPFRRRIPMPVPTSFLIDGKGRLTAIYRGTVSASQVAADSGLFEISDSDLLKVSLPFMGQWLFTPKAPAPMARGIELMGDGDVVDAAEFAIRNLELLKPHKEFPLLAIWISEKLMASGDTNRGLQFLHWAAEGDGSNLAVVNNLAWQLAANPSERVRDPKLALLWAQKANTMTKGSHPTILDTVAVAYAATGDFKKAIEVMEKGIGIAEAREEDAIANPMKKRLELFKAGKPYLEPAPESK